MKEANRRVFITHNTSGLRTYFDVEPQEDGSWKVISKSPSLVTDFTGNIYSGSFKNGSALEFEGGKHLPLTRFYTVVTFDQI